MRKYNWDMIISLLFPKIFLTLSEICRDTHTERKRCVNKDFFLFRILTRRI